MPAPNTTSTSSPYSLPRADHRHGEEWFRTILNTEPATVMLLDAAGSIVDTNPAGLELLQADEYVDVIGQPIAPFVAPGDRDRISALTADVFLGNRDSIIIELVGCRGRRRRVEHRAVPLRDASGAIVAALSISTDITEQYETEAALRHRANQHAV